jgi:hypothetical protein
MTKTSAWKVVGAYDYHVKNARTGKNPAWFVNVRTRSATRVEIYFKESKKHTAERQLAPSFDEAHAQLDGTPAVMDLLGVQFRVV